MRAFQFGFAKGCFARFQVLFLAWSAMATAAPWTWKPVPAPQPAALASTVRMGGELYVGWGNGIMRSLDSGKTWALQSTVPAPDLEAVDSTLFIFPEMGLLRSTDRGKTFTQVGAAFGSLRVRRIKAMGKVWLALAGGGPTDFISQSWFSTDKGLTWTPANRFAATGARTVLAMDTLLFIGESDSGVFRSRDRGLTWELLKGGLPTGSSTLLRFRDGKLYDVAGERGLFVSADAGTGWKPLPLALNAPKGVTPLVVDLEAQAANLFVNIYTGTGFGGVFGSSDAGKTWQPLRNGLPPMHDSADVLLNSVNWLRMQGNRLIVQVGGGSSPNQAGLFQSLDAGAHWAPVSITIPAELQRSPEPYFDFFNGVMLLDDFGNAPAPKSCLSVDFGASWKCSPAFIHGGTEGLFAQGNDVYAGFQSRSYYSPDLGGHWFDRAIPSLSSMALQGNDLFVITGNTVSHSPDKGATWDNRVLRTMAIGSTRFMSESGNLMASEDGGGSWRFTGSGLPAMAVNGASTFTILGKSIFAATQKGLFRSEDEAATWTPVGIGLPSAEVTGLAAIGGHVLLQTVSGAFRGDEGAEGSEAVADWKPAAWAPNFQGFAAQDTILFGVTGPADWGVLASYDGGSTWRHASGTNPMPFARAIASGGGRLTVSKGSLYFHSTDQGGSWDTLKSVNPPPSLMGLTQIGRQLLAVNPGGIWTSVDGGMRWTFLEGTGAFGFASVTSLGPMLYGAGYAGLAVSGDTGKSWTKLPLAPENPILVGAYGQKLWVATAGGGVWVGRNPDFSTALLPDEPPVPSGTAFALSGLGSDGFFIRVGEEAAIAFSIFDGRGRAIVSRREGSVAPGWHRYAWNGNARSGFPASRSCFFRITVRSVSTPGKILFDKRGRVP
jgi:hypothetical protein